LKYGEPDLAYRTYLKPQVDAVLDRAGIGGISELCDLSGTRGPEYQAWSMSGFLEAVHAFAGVRIDVPRRWITVEPQLPSCWPHLNVRKWYGRVPFDLRYAEDDVARTLHLEFPWGDPPEVTMEVSLLLPSRRTVATLDVLLDGVPQSPVWRVEAVAGSDRERLRFSVAASRRVEMTLRLRKVTARLVHTA